MIIREYFDDYVKYWPEKWRWSLSNEEGQNELYLRTRARKSNDFRTNCDLRPDFYSIERDAAQFGYESVEWVDFFGLKWKGEKGVLAYAGAPNYQGSLYYYDPEERDEEPYISDLYDAYSNQPPEDTYTRVEYRGITRWVDTVHVCDIKYKYIVDNHLFKDTHIELIYEDGEIVRVYGDSGYHNIIAALRRHGKDELVSKVLRDMNEHFIKLRDSENDGIRAYYPGKTAEEMFLGEGK